MPHFFLGNQNIHRVQKGVNDRRNWYEQNIDISYNLSVSDKYTFNAVWRNNVKDVPHQNESIINNMLTARQLTNSNTYYSYHDNCIMESVVAEGNQLVIMQDNQGNYQSLQVGPMMVLRGLDVFGMKDFLTLSLERGLARYWSYGNAYTHTYNNLYYNA